MNINLRAVAMYLPQYHPVPDNDTWWGKGFTEWTNVAKSKPLFEGHYQPHLPSDLGFYDLRVAEVREQQAQMAKDFGIHGFCYYHYWFNGRRILERPFNEVFESGEPALPFMLCWANENWTRAWDGKDKEILLQQKYSEEDDRNHIRTLIPYFKDARYIKIDGKPVFAIYRSKLLPHPKRTVEIWREEAAKEGLELYLCRFENFSSSGEADLKEGGFNAAVDFQPFGFSYNAFQQYMMEQMTNRTLLQKLNDKWKETFSKKYRQKVKMKFKVWDYEAFTNFVMQQPFPGYNWFPGITPGFDNYARKKEHYFIINNSTPALYKRWLQHIVRNYKPKSPNENLLFINAWNEWAEGNHLEPCHKWGKQYLEATKSALNA